MIAKLKKSCSIDIKSSNLMSCLSLSTMTLLVFASIVMMTIISVTPIIILGIGELPEGQRDIIIEPRLEYLNSTKLSEAGRVTALPRVKLYLGLDKGRAVTGWLMDFRSEREHHLGNIGGDEPPMHNFIYAHEELGFAVDQEITLTLLQKNLLEGVRNAVMENRLLTDRKTEVMNELSVLEATELTMSGKFRVKEVFDTSSGKFGIGQVNNYIYLDIRWALQQMVNHTY